MVAISVVICCANAADTLEAACVSARFADELLIVDSGSEDDTPRIARQYAHRYVVEPWRGYTGQKRYAASLAKNDWVFVLDGDEEIDDRLAGEIQSLTAEKLDKLDVLYMRRRNYIMGRPARAYGPDWQSRLIHRHRVTWPEEALHEDRLPSAPDRVAKLGGMLLHKRTSAAGFSDYFGGKRMDERLLPVAQAMYDRGKRCRWWDLWIRPTSAFIKFYLIKLGFLDGGFGLLIAQKAAVSAQLKYAALWAIQHGQHPPAAAPQAHQREDATEGAYS